MQFQLTILGSNSAIPANDRFPSAQVLKVQKRQYLIDCGEGTQLRLSQNNISKKKINQIFISHLHGDHVFGLIGLIMLFSGCATSEAAGLEVADIRLDCEVPHIRFGPNSHRRLDKGRLERSVPIAATLLNHLKAHNLSNNGEAGAFGKYSEASSYSNVSTQLNNVIRDKLEVSDPSLVSYSTRHTFKDRGRAARISPEIVDYLQGHVTKSSSAIAQRYGTGVPPSVYLEDLTKILGTTTWGDSG